MVNVAMMQSVAVLFQLIVLIGGFVVFYFIVKAAVKNGTIEAYKIMDEQNIKKRPSDSDNI